jgi:hypothetical protein
MLMPHQTLVKALPRRPNRVVEILRATFQDDADAVQQHVFLAGFKKLAEANWDPRMERAHRQVLTNIAEHISDKTGTAYPDWRSIAEEEGLGEGTVRNCIYELKKWGYLVWERRESPDQHAGRLTHYTLPVVSYSRDEMVAGIEAWCAEMRREIPRPWGKNSTPPAVQNGEVYTAHGVRNYTAHGVKSDQNGESTPPTVQKTTPSAVQKTTPSAVQKTTPSAVQEFTPPAVQNGRNTPPAVQNGRNTPPAVQNGSNLHRLRGNRSNDNNHHHHKRGVLDEDAKALLDRAVDLYNRYAEKHDFRRYSTRSDATDKRFYARLLKIGGLEKLELALNAIPTVDFYMGRIEPKPGQSRFRMHIDFLLSEGSGSGDVLSGLIDRALDKPAPPAPQPRGRPGR